MKFQKKNGERKERLRTSEWCPAFPTSYWNLCRHFRELSKLLGNCYWKIREKERKKATRARIGSHLKEEKKNKKKIEKRYSLYIYKRGSVASAHRTLRDVSVGGERWKSKEERSRGWERELLAATFSRACRYSLTRSGAAQWRASKSTSTSGLVAYNVHLSTSTTTVQEMDSFVLLARPTHTTWFWQISSDLPNQSFSLSFSLHLFVSRSRSVTFVRLRSILSL